MEYVSFSEQMILQEVCFIPGADINVFTALLLANW